MAFSKLWEGISGPFKCREKRLGATCASHLIYEDVRLSWPLFYGSGCNREITGVDTSVFNPTDLNHGTMGVEAPRLGSAAACPIPEHHEASKGKPLVSG